MASLNRIKRITANRYKQLKYRLVVTPVGLLKGGYDAKYLFVSHHKCASQYVAAVLEDVCFLKKIPSVRVNWQSGISGFSLRINKFLLVTDYSADALNLNKIEGRGFHVIRDPRDILISMYYSHKYSHPIRKGRAGGVEIARDREVLRTMDMAGGLRYLMDHSGFFKRACGAMENWDYENTNFYETRFERITAAPQEDFQRIFDFIGLDIAPEKLGRILQKHSFQNMRKRWRQSGRTLEHNHYRKGVPGDWKNYLSQENKQIFKDRYGGLLVRLGYEKDDNW